MKLIVNIVLIVAMLIMPYPTLAAADDTVDKTICKLAVGYQDVDEIQADLLAAAKREVINELFGEMIVASTAVENFVVTSDQIRTSSIGFVRVDGNADFFQGEGFAEVCVTIQAYVTDEDKAQFIPERLEKKYCDADDDMTTAQLIAYVKDEAVIQRLIEYNPDLKGTDRDSLLQLVQKVSYPESGFIPDTQTYCATFEGEVIPVEVMAFLETMPESDTISQPIAADQHLGWAGAVHTENIYSITVKDYNSKSQYILKGNVVILGRIGNCIATNGTVSIETAGKTNRIWEWNNNNLNCIEADETGWPQNPNLGTLSSEFEQLIRETVLPQGSEFAIDVTQYIKRDGKYTISWDYLSGCCGIFIGGMELYAEEAADNQQPVSTVNSKCDLEGTVRSLPGTTKTTISIANLSSTHLELFWLDYDGQRVSYGKIAPGETKTQSSYTTHPWVIVRDSDKVCLQLITDVTTTPDITIRD